MYLFSKHEEAPSDLTTQVKIVHTRQEQNNGRAFFVFTLFFLSVSKIFASRLSKTSKSTYVLEKLQKSC